MLNRRTSGIFKWKKICFYCFRFFPLSWIHGTFFSLSPSSTRCRESSLPLPFSHWIYHQMLPCSLRQAIMATRKKETLRRIVKSWELFSSLFSARAWTKSFFLWNLPSFQLYLVFYDDSFHGRWCLSFSHSHSSVISPEWRSLSCCRSTSRCWCRPEGQKNVDLMRLVQLTALVDENAENNLVDWGTRKMPNAVVTADNEQSIDSLHHTKTKLFKAL